MCQFENLEMSVMLIAYIIWAFSKLVPVQTGIDTSSHFQIKILHLGILNFTITFNRSISHAKIITR